MRSPLGWLLLAGRFLAVALGLSGVLATITLAVTAPRPPAPWAEVLPEPAGWSDRWSQLRPGMTREDVVSLLGPPSVTIRRPDAEDVCTDLYGYPDYATRHETLDLCFGQDGRLTGLPGPGLRFDLRTTLVCGSPTDLIPLGIVLGVAILVVRFAIQPRVLQSEIPSRAGLLA